MHLSESPAETGAALLRNTYDKPVHDLGERGFPEFRGIYSPIYEADYVNRFIHDQFQGGAETYAKHYEKFGFFEQLLRRAVGMAGVSDAQAILDIGSGSGNSIVPLLNLFPTASVIASDLSPQLLAILRDHLKQRNDRARCALLQLNAEELDFRVGSFDLVVGAAILHHLFHPEKAIAGAARILQPGGAAIFIEPFENGNYILRMAYHQILSDPRAGDLHKNVATFLRNRIAFCDERRGADKSDPKYMRFDDKWNFTLAWFHRLAEASGFTKCTHFAIGNPDAPFESKARVHLKGKTGDQDPLPEWAWDIIREYDRNTSKELRQDLPVEAVVVLTK